MKDVDFAWIIKSCWQSDTEGHRALSKLFRVQYFECVITDVENAGLCNCRNVFRIFK